MSSCGWQRSTSRDWHGRDRDVRPCPTWYPTSVQKTSVYLTDQEVARLARLADREGMSQAEIIRRAIRQYEPDRRRDRRFALIEVADGPGGSIADIAEADQLEGFGA